MVIQIVLINCYWCNAASDFKISNWIGLQQQVQNFGEPFFLVIHEGETLAEIKVRIQKKLQVSDEEFSKVQCFSTSLSSNWNILAYF